MSRAADHAGTVLCAAVASRLLLLGLIVLWRTVLSPYDTSAPLNFSCLSSPIDNASAQPVLWPYAAAAVEGSVVWDGVYYVRIAECGYEYEQSYAFLPLLPISLTLLSRIVAPLVTLIGQRAVLGLCGYVLNNIAFVFAAVYFYRLSVIILKDPEAALRASILFCFNPASIFYSSIYSESLYALSSIGGLYHLISGADYTAMLWFALSGSARSNGVLNAGYFCFQTMFKAYDAIFFKKNASLAVQVLIGGALRCLFIFIPFIAFQAYGYYNICFGRSPEEMRPWCKAKPPLLYNYLQIHYWGVGFLRYFQLKQLPNFLLASPILSLAFCSVAYYVRSRPEIVFSLGFRASLEEKRTAATHISLGGDPILKSAYFSEKPSIGMYRAATNRSLRKRKLKIKDSDFAARPMEDKSLVGHGYLSVTVLPFVLHLGFMAATAFFVMHVQVATRFLSASPPIYWFASYLIVSPGSTSRWGYLIWAYSAAFILHGSLLFSNFYPFT